RALPEPAPEATQPAAEPGARSSLEEVVATVWEQVLGRERVHPADHFFDLGGHSLSATRVVSRLRDLLGIELPVRALFEEPTVAGLARRVTAAFAATAGLGDHPAPLMVRVPRTGELPLSFGQQRLWFLAELVPDSPFYNSASVLALSGPLDVAALARSCGEIVRRHEALRTTFRSAAGRPVQAIAAELALPFPVVDLGGLAAASRGPEAERIALEEAGTPFDLARGPLVRARLLRQAAADHLLVLDLHHIVADDWSMDVLTRELAALYRAFISDAAAGAAGRPSPLPELPLQYADFAAWQREWLRGPVLDAQLAFWKAHLAGAPPVHDLQGDRPRPAAQSFSGALFPLALPGGLSRELRQLGRREGSTLFMTLLAAYEALLLRYSGSADLVVGTPIANRTHREIEELIGFFVNMLVLRAAVPGAASYRDLLGRVREVALAAYAHQDLPFEKLVLELDPERDLSRNPLFQLVFILQNAATRKVAILPDLALERRDVDWGVTRFDLTLSLTEGPAGIAGFFDYSTDLFDAVTLSRMAQNFAVLLQGLLAHPELPLAALPLLAAAEARQLLVEWNRAADRPEAPPAPFCLHERFAAQAARTPAAVALVTAAERLTYRDLERRSARLARRLRRLGVGPEVRVAVCLERTADLIVALLATLRAGGAYVPLDPHYPPARLALLMADAGAAVLLTREPLLERLPGHTGPLLCLEDLGAEADLLAGADAGADADADADVDIDADAPRPTPGNLAYLIYTSGSTGRPKAVAIEHRSAAALVDWAGRTFGPDRLRGVFAGTSVCFDLSVFEIFAPLCLGGTVILGEDGLALATHPAAAEVTLVNTVPSVLAELLAGGGLPAGVRTVNLAGEPLPGALVRQIHEKTAAEVWNLYGPSEDTTYSTGAHISRDSREGALPPAIGRPIAHGEAYLLDPHGRPVPVGVPGELYLGGPGLARGYLGRPDLTAERFLPHPWSERPGARLYRTGDLTRYRPDGNLEFLGRADHQVKVRGFRIELGEVEAALERHPAVGRALVLASGEGQDRRLVAYLAPVPPAPAAQIPANPELREHLRQALPDYMVPGVFVRLAAFPLTPNGKIDRRALPAPEPEVAAANPGEPLALTPMEEVVATIWEQVLGHERVHPADNFFDLGGHSLTATQVTSRLRDALGVELTVRILFEQPTVAGLARRLTARLAGQLGAGDDRLAPPLRPAPRDRPLPLSFAQQRLWFLAQLVPESPFYNMPAALHLTGPLDVSALARSCNEIVRRHEALRTTFPAVQGVAAQVVAPALAIPLPVVDLRRLGGESRTQEADRIALAEARTPFDLTRGPLLRALLLRTGEQEHVLVLTLHHIVSDGWSITVFSRELSALYRAFTTDAAGTAGRPSPLPELPLQYADFAVWQREWLTGSVLAAQLAYWQAQLAGAPPVHELQGDRPRPAVQSYRGALLPLALPRPLAQALRDLGRRSGSTLFMTLLAAYKALLLRYTGSEDLVVGAPIANRTYREIEDLIGFFVNALVLRTPVRGAMTFRELLGRVREVSLAAYAHQDLPFEKLVLELDPERDLSRNPLFQLAFALQNATARDVELSPGLTLERREIDWGTTRFDLTLFLWETGQGIAGLLDYSTDLFDAATIARLAGHVKTLAAGLVAEPDAPLAALPLLGGEEREQLLVGFAGSRTAYPREESIPALFGAVAARVPERVALAAQGVAVTYGELDRRADRLARRLRRHRVGPDVLVGLYLERSLEMIVAMLGVLKAGGAFLPLDLQYPRERLAYMLHDARPAVLLTAAHLAPRLPADGGATVLHLADPGAESAAVPPAAVHPASLAYVMYTSGSTGRPKGVAAVHRGVVRLVRESDFADLSEAQVFLQLAPISFDASTLEIWAPLLNGGRLAILPHERSSLEEIGAALAQHGVTTLWLTASLFHLMVEERLADLAPLSQLLAGGDVLSPAHVERVLRELPGCTVINGYGPTENTTFTCCHPMRGPLRLRGPVPLGRPIANTQVYLLDGGLEPVPVGVPGDLYIGGDGLVRGYLGRPELTAERFLPNPLAGTPGERLYRSGDRARFRPDGTVEFLGRVDHQVKVRGFRIELGEIESVLCQQAGVKAAAVVVHEVDGDKRLVAYVAQDLEAGAALPAADSEPQQVEHWQMLYESTYGQDANPGNIAGGTGDGSFNIVGWNSSYTGGAIPAAEMQVWRESTVERISALAPDRVLEIGCGTGLLLFRLAPGCSRYVGTDFSRQALGSVARAIGRGRGLPQVELLERLADDFSGLAPGSFDTVVVNSVVQYFPSAEYLLRVLAGAVRAVRPGGAIFVGDVRSLPLLRAFHTAVELHQAPPELAKAQLRHRIEKQLLQEEELLLSPVFFAAVRRHLPQIGRVEVQVKRGRHHNELTQFRYDVVLRLAGEEEAPPPEPVWLDWQAEGLTVAELGRRLAATMPERLGLRAVPNARVLAAVRGVELLAADGGDGGPRSAGEVWQEAQAGRRGGVEPEDLWRLAQELPYAVGIGWTD
ncbi:MAG TPA: amino acid adenylation domain-containing protein, partial [Thermoanaerobaculia bacterium]|nr:amino acid adenylation domain-containing protein [Thermoanaerobaculia bacterium]